MGQSQKGCRVGAAAAVGGHLLGVECKNRCAAKANIKKYNIGVSRRGYVKKRCNICNVSMMYKGLYCFCCSARLRKRIRGSTTYTGKRY